MITNSTFLNGFACEQLFL